MNCTGNECIKDSSQRIKYRITSCQINEFFFYSYTDRDDTLGTVRYSKYMEMAATNKTIKIESLPPYERAACQHSFRVYLQVMDWKYLEENHYDPSDWGWSLKGGFYHPILADEPVAPDHLLKFVR